MQGPRADEALQRLDGYEQMVDIFAEQAKSYWECGAHKASIWFVWSRAGRIRNART